jgi:predicted aldo/keto reductase-like oxidoreductase
MRSFFTLRAKLSLFIERSRITTLSVGAAIPEELEAIINVCERNQPLYTAEIAVFNRLEAHLTDKLTTDSM